jgi:hypothetical protein
LISVYATTAMAALESASFMCRSRMPLNDPRHGASLGAQNIRSASR